MHIQICIYTAHYTNACTDYRYTTHYTYTYTYTYTDIHIQIYIYTTHYTYTDIHITNCTYTLLIYYCSFITHIHYSLLIAH